MPSSKEGNDGREGAVAKAAGAAVAVGLAWGLLRFVKARKEEDVLIQEYYGDRVDFTVPGGEKSASYVNGVYIEEEIEAAKTHPPPLMPTSPVSVPDTNELKMDRKDETEVAEEPKPHKPEAECDGKPNSHKPAPLSEEKPWFLRLFDLPKKAESKNRLKGNQTFEVKDCKPKESDAYEIKKGDTLWAISRRYEVPLDALKAANGLHGDQIYTGDKLVIPDK